MHFNRVKTDTQPNPQRKISQFPTCGKRTEASSASIDLQKQIQEIQTEIDRFMMLLLDANPTTANYINERIQFLDQKKNDYILYVRMTERFFNTLFHLL